jgi:hypothetical protein
LPVSAWPAVTFAVQVVPRFESTSTGLTATATDALVTFLYVAW